MRLPLQSRERRLRTESRLQSTGCRAHCAAALRNNARAQCWQVRSTPACPSQPRRTPIAATARTLLRKYPRTLVYNQQHPVPQPMHRVRPGRWPPWAYGALGAGYALAAGFSAIYVAPRFMGPMEVELDEAPPRGAPAATRTPLVVPSRTPSCIESARAPGALPPTAWARMGA